MSTPISDCVLRPFYWCQPGDSIAYLKAIDLATLISNFEFTHVDPTEGCNATELDYQNLWRDVLKRMADITTALGITFAIYPLGNSEYFLIECCECED